MTKKERIELLDKLRKQVSIIQDGYSSILHLRLDIRSKAKSKPKANLMKIFKASGLLPPKELDKVAHALYKLEMKELK